MRIILGDCLAEMDKLIAEGITVDLTVTSPPYDNLRIYGKGLDWNEDIWKQAIEKLYQITKKGGVVVWVVGDATIQGSETGTSFRQALYFKEVGFNLHDTMIYYRWSGPLTHRRYEQEFEYMFVMSKGKPKTFHPLEVRCKYYKKESDRANKLYKYHNQINHKMRSGKERNNIKKFRIFGNVWKINNTSHSAESNGHPAQFPEKLANDHIISWSNVGDLVFDPFMGSGTTGKMAKFNNRDFIGIEKVDEYFMTAKKRINETEIYQSLIGE